MFKFKIEERDGYIYETNTIPTLERYLTKNCLPRSFKFKISITKNFEFCEDLKITDRLLMIIGDGGSTARTINGTIHLDKEWATLEENQPFPNPLRPSEECKNGYEYLKNQFIKELLVSCMLNNSASLRYAYNKGLIDAQIAIESNTNWRFYLSVTDKYLEQKDAIMVTPFDSVKSVSNPMLLNPNLFNAYLLFCMLTGKPVALFPEVVVRSGYLGDKKPQKVDD